MNDIGVIQLRNGEFTIVDSEHFQWLNRWKWFVNHSGYAIRRKLTKGKCKAIFLHRLVNKTQDGQFTDHVNGFKLDNTSINLRTANKSQNACNCPKRNDGSSSRFKGVRWDEKRKTWVAYLSGGKNKHLGQFDSEEKAAEAYNRAAKEKYGDFAKLNVVSQP